MRRAGQLYDRICSWENLELAARRARKRKRYRPYAEDFELRRETVLREIQAELTAGTWMPGPYRAFRIYDPKERVICAAPYRDRIVHHAICNVIGPLLDGSMIAHTYSCRVGKGTSAARLRCRSLVRAHRYVLKLDVVKYFASVDHEILKEKLRRRIKCAPTLALLDRIIDSWHDREAPPRWFSGDGLLAPLERSAGLPIGSLTSQLFANFYLSRVDHLVEEALKPAGYVRYTDDMVLFSDSKRFLWRAFDRLKLELERERLKLHEAKSRVFRCEDGVPFLGFRFLPSCVRVLRENRLRFERRMTCIRRRRRRGGRDLERVWPSMFGWFQFVREFPVNEGLVRDECSRQVF